MLLKSLVRVAGVGGAVAAGAAIKKLKNKQKKNTAPSHNEAFISSENVHPLNSYRKFENVSFASVLAKEQEAFSDAQDIDNVDLIIETLKEANNVELVNESLSKPNEMSKQQAQAEKLKAAITRARNMVWCKMNEAGVPGMVVAVSLNGKIVWQHGFGYSDLENHLITGTGCVMRIASISKSITMAVLARLWQEGKIDLDKNVSEYVPSFPKKYHDGKEVNITVRQLCCHMSGVRHYLRKGEKDEDEFSLKEYFLKETFKSTDESLKLFQDDELLSAPGSEFNYTTHGYTLLAKVIENVVGEPFEKYMKKQFAILGLNNTYLDKAEPIIYNRAKYYVRDKHNRLENAPYVDNSYKWAGGGYLSTVGDLVKFGNAMLYSYQQKNVSSSNSTSPKLPEEKPPLNSKTENNTDVNNKSKTEKTVENVVYQHGPLSTANNGNGDNKTDKKIRYLPGYLSSSTIQEMWTPQAGADMTWGGHDLTYGLGWAVRKRLKNYGYCMDQTHYVSHTGGAIGASSVLLVAPSQPGPNFDSSKLPQGVVVAILCNMQGVGLNKLGADVAAVFQGLDLDKPVRVHKVYQC